MAVAVIQFIFFLIDAVLGLLVLAIIVSAILSWLFAFDVINYRNRFVASLAETLDRITAPILAPLRSIIPSLGGLDVSPIVALLIIHGIRIYLLPASQAAALSLVVGY
ncbi:YggT family protein [Brevundimonas vitis]|uniref:YggT family protein n=1 Tax=Brevundimonas vitisensis TaxID=2800818 RepID=A0ABX7BJZ1_9CAUL|nr:YggT family protein [Brevundimonas vitisensis]QQQ17710.1 YggT family protein [Brevundimonas vitisensis]